MENKKFENPPIIEEGLPMIELAAELGLVETNEMVNLRNRMIKILKMTNLFSKKDGTEATEFGKTMNKALDLFDNLYSKYESLAEEIVDQYEGDKFYRAQIAYLIIEASIFRAGGHMLDYEEKVDQVLQYADSLGYDDISQRYWIL